MRVIRALSDKDFKELNNKTFKSRFTEFFFFENLIWSFIFISYSMTISEVIIFNILFYFALMKLLINYNFRVIFN